MFFELIEKLRNKPEQNKQKIVLGISIVFSLVIFFIWLVTLDFDRGTGREVTTEVSEPASYGPIDSFKEIFSNFFENVPEIKPEEAP